MHETNDELAALRRRAYARDGDISTDPVALARLVELEGTRGRVVDDAAAPAPDQTSEQPVGLNVEDNSNAPDDQKVSVLRSRTVRRVQLPRPRRSTVLMLAAATLVTVFTLTSLELVQRVQTDPLQVGATQAARLAPDPTFSAPTALAHGTPEQSTVYAPYQGFRAVTYPAPARGGHCMSVWHPDLLQELSDNGYAYEGTNPAVACGAGVFPPSWTLLLLADTPERRASDLPAGTALQFVFDADSNEVVVFLG